MRSSMFVASDEATARYVDARLGMRARQKSVLYFRVHAGGRSKMYVLRAKPGGHGLPAVARLLRSDGDQIFLLRQPAHRVHEQVAITLNAEHAI